MKELNDKRREAYENERNQLKLISKYLEQKRKRFEYADTSQWLLQDKNETDLIFISEKLNEWSGKAKEENKKQFDDLIVALFRVQSYCSNLETICKSAVSEYSLEAKNVSKLESEIRALKIQHQNEISTLKLELQNVKKENEFLSGSR